MRTRLADLPVFKKLEDASAVLVAGCGGGFDVFCGLPIYLALAELGKEVYLSNLTFSGANLSRALPAERLTEALVAVTADSPLAHYYFPEKHLCGWFRSRGEEVKVFCVEKTGVVPMVEAYRWLRDELALDAVVVVDGGTDSLMRGDEPGLGTPHEDMATLIALSEVDLPVRWLATIGFGVDAYHGVCHHHFLEAVADLTRAGAFHGAHSLLAEMPEHRLYQDASEHVFEAMPEHVSIVNTSILSAVEGRFGDHHRTTRTAGSRLWINPLMALYWFFDLPAVAKRLLYRDEMRTTRTMGEIARVIQVFRERLSEIKPRRIIPV
ncbi:MAG: DUF1152 domain-containing protein [bacterium]|nr:DUF1152 domain-containing protein [bacterium]